MTDLGNPFRPVSATDLAEMSTRWAARWPDCRPIGHEFRASAPDRWVRFHSLPGSKRYADSNADHAEILTRHNAVVRALADGDQLLVVVCAWSHVSEPPPLGAVERSLLPTASYWQSILRESDDGEEFWNHLFVSSALWSAGVCDHIFRSVADTETSDVFIAPADLAWLYHPYDGGADVIAETSEHRDAIRGRYQAWLSGRSDGL